MSLSNLTSQRSSLGTVGNLWRPAGYKSTEVSTNQQLAELLEIKAADSDALVVMRETHGISSRAFGGALYQTNDEMWCAALLAARHESRKIKDALRKYYNTGVLAQGDEHLSFDSPMFMRDRYKKGGSPQYDLNVDVLVKANPALKVGVVTRVALRKTHHARFEILGAQDDQEEVLIEGVAYQDARDQRAAVHVVDYSGVHFVLGRKGTPLDLAAPLLVKGMRVGELPIVTVDGADVVTYFPVLLATRSPSVDFTTSGLPCSAVSPAARVAMGTSSGLMKFLSLPLRDNEFMALAVGLKSLVLAVLRIFAPSFSIEDKDPDVLLGHACAVVGSRLTHVRLEGHKLDSWYANAAIGDTPLSAIWEWKSDWLDQHGASRAWSVKSALGLYLMFQSRFHFVDVGLCPAKPSAFARLVIPPTPARLGQVRVFVAPPPQEAMRSGSMQIFRGWRKEGANVAAAAVGKVRTQDGFVRAMRGVNSDNVAEGFEAVRVATDFRPFRDPLALSTGEVFAPFILTREYGGSASEAIEEATLSIKHALGPMAGGVIMSVFYPDGDRVSVRAFAIGHMLAGKTKGDVMDVMDTRLGSVDIFPRSSSMYGTATNLPLVSLSLRTIW